MTIVLQNNRSDSNHINKNITDVATLNGTLKSETSIIDPVILIEGNVNISKCNYLHIADFGRYYYINNVVSVRNNLWEIHAHVDVLQSFKNEILNNKAIIRKAGRTQDCNFYINDGTFHVYQNPIINTRRFPHGFTTNEFVLAVAGR